MKFKVKAMDITTGNTLVAILNSKDAAKFDLHVLDRIKIRKNRKNIEAVLDIGKSLKAIPSGSIGLFEETLEALNAKQGDIINICLAKKPLSLQYIRKKLDGGTLSKKEIEEIINDIVNNRLSSIELTYFVSACYTHALDTKETIMLVKAMVNCGSTLKLNKYPIIDKHCIGGVPGNRTTMIIVPIIAAAGLTIPKTSSRSITSPSGTADTMEVLTNVCLNLNQMKRVVNKTNGCIVWGGSLNLAPADDKIIKVERPLEINAESQFLASIMAKKMSVSSTHILIDIPVGKSAKLEGMKLAKNLKKDFIRLAKKLKRKIKVMITDGSQPIGNGIGPALEARDVLYVLQGDYRQPNDLRKKSIEMAGKILEMGKKAKPGQGKKKALEILESGQAYKKMKEIIKAQGGGITDSENIKLGRYAYDVTSKKSGRIKYIDNKIITRIARVAGAPKDKKAGIYLYNHIGDRVKKGDKLFTVYSDGKEQLKFAKEVVKESSAIVLK
ncbi:MAG: AMP phosphorylase [Candidatus Woesearchaeota archaeon]|jgi:AMP phosphorylase|nr:AMP phosphorylase [Candidatus Woesearchaeota archaeon]|tara:strand:- start:2021 stop:3514 length:1494 start_codon:yes stop_codon:yes gene_type:complete